MAGLSGHGCICFVNVRMSATALLHPGTLQMPVPWPFAHKLWLLRRHKAARPTLKPCQAAPRVALFVDSIPLYGCIAQRMHLLRHALGWHADEDTHQQAGGAMKCCASLSQLRHCCEALELFCADMLVPHRVGEPTAAGSSHCAPCATTLPLHKLLTAGAAGAQVKAKLGGRVRLLTTGASPIGADVIAFLRCAFPGAHVLEGYGAPYHILVMPGGLFLYLETNRLPCAAWILWRCLRCTTAQRRSHGISVVHLYIC